jgi:hypothetical protein
MPEVTLLEKGYGSFSPEKFGRYLSSLCQGLHVKLKDVRVTSRGWVQIEVSGEDEVAVLTLLEREVGLTPGSLNELTKFNSVRGKVVFSGGTSFAVKSCLCVDIGIHVPKSFDAFLPLQTLRAQLADGRKLPLPKLIDLFCLYDHFPIEVKITQEADFHKTGVEAELSEGQLAQFDSWIRSGFDRLVVSGAFLSDVEASVSRAKHVRDVLQIASLGILEQVILCKLGTDAVGLISTLGRFLPFARLIPFSPKKIRHVINRSFL